MKQFIGYSSREACDTCFRRVKEDREYLPIPQFLCRDYRCRLRLSDSSEQNAFIHA